MLFFFSNMWPKDESRGITKKVFAQMKAFDALGHPVKYYTGYLENGAAVFDRDGKTIYSRKFPTNNDHINRFCRNYTLKKMTIDFLQNNPEHFAEMYFRYLFFDSLSAKLFKEAKRHSDNVILEMHSYPNYNKGQYMLYPIFLIDRLYRSKSIKNVDLIVAISKVKNIFGKPTVNIDNGIDLDGTIPQKKEKRKDNSIVIVSVSYEWLAHGYDRLLYGLSNYYKNNPSEIVRVVFVGTIMDSTKKLIDRLKLNEYVECVGIKKGDELDEIYNQCDIGMGCLAVHRCNTNDSSGLKTKEYIAKGIPFFYAGEPLFDKESFPYALQMESNESPIDIDSIVSFYKKITSNNDYQRKIREWAKDYTWEAQLAKVFDKQ